MVFKFATLFALVAAANAGLIPAAPAAYAATPIAYATPVAKAVVAKTIDPEYDPHPQYSYGYDVQDALTGDFKSQHESRDGDVVQGSYSLLESDGTRRIVDYTADPINGFNAVVHKEPAQVAVKAVAAAPLAIKTVAHAPLAYAAPVAKIAHAPVAYAAPAAYAAAPAYAHATYAAPAAYAAAPTYAHAAYAAPAIANIAAPLTYGAHAAYTHASPLAYAGHAAYAHAAPAYLH